MPDPIDTLRREAAIAKRLGLPEAPELSLRLRDEEARRNAESGAAAAGFVDPRVTAGVIPASERDASLESYKDVALQMRMMPSQRQQRLAAEGANTGFLGGTGQGLVEAGRTVKQMATGVDLESFNAAADDAERAASMPLTAGLGRGLGIAATQVIPAVATGGASIPVQAAVLGGVVAPQIGAETILRLARENPDMSAGELTARGVANAAGQTLLMGAGNALSRAIAPALPMAARAAAVAADPALRTAGRATTSAVAGRVAGTGAAELAGQGAAGAAGDLLDAGLDPNRDATLQSLALNAGIGGVLGAGTAVPMRMGAERAAIAAANAERAARAGGRAASPFRAGEIRDLTMGRDSANVAAQREMDAELAARESMQPGEPDPMLAGDPRIPAADLEAAAAERRASIDAHVAKVYAARQAEQARLEARAAVQEREAALAADQARQAQEARATRDAEAAAQLKDEGFLTRAKRDRDARRSKVAEFEQNVENLQGLQESLRAPGLPQATYDAMRVQYKQARAALDQTMPGKVAGLAPDQNASLFRSRIADHHANLTRRAAALDAHIAALETRVAAHRQPTTAAPAAPKAPTNAPAAPAPVAHRAPVQPLPSRPVAQSADAGGAGVPVPELRPSGADGRLHAGGSGSAGRGVVGSEPAVRPAAGVAEAPAGGAPAAPKRHTLERQGKPAIADRFTLHADGSSAITTMGKSDIPIHADKAHAEADAKIAAGAPGYQGGKGKMTALARTIIRGMNPVDRDKITVMREFFGGSGYYGLSMADLLPNLRKLHISELIPSRREAIGYGMNRGRSFLADWDAIPVETKDDLGRKVHAQIANGGKASGSAIAKIFRAQHAKETDPNTRAVLDILAAHGENSFGSKMKDDELAFGRILEIVAKQQAALHDRAEAFRARGGEIVLDGSDAYASTGIAGDHVLSIIDGPYYGTKGYDGTGAKVGADIYGKTAALVRKQAEDGNAILFTDSAWMHAKPEDLPPDTAQAAVHARDIQASIPRTDITGFKVGKRFEFFGFRQQSDPPPAMRESAPAGDTPAGRAAEEQRIVAQGLPRPPDAPRPPTADEGITAMREHATRVLERGPLSEGLRKAGAKVEDVEGIGPMIVLPGSAQGRVTGLAFTPVQAFGWNAENWLSSAFASVGWRDMARASYAYAKRSGDDALAAKFSKVEDAAGFRKVFASVKQQEALADAVAPRQASVVLVDGKAVGTLRAAVSLRAGLQGQALNDALAEEAAQVAWRLMSDVERRGVLNATGKGLSVKGKSLSLIEVEEIGQGSLRDVLANPKLLESKPRTTIQGMIRNALGKLGAVLRIPGAREWGQREAVAVPPDLAAAQTLTASIRDGSIWQRKAREADLPGGKPTAEAYATRPRSQAEEGANFRHWARFEPDLDGGEPVTLSDAQIRAKVRGEWRAKFNPDDPLRPVGDALVDEGLANAVHEWTLTGAKGSFDALVKRIKIDAHDSSAGRGLTLAHEVFHSLMRSGLRTPNAERIVREAIGDAHANELLSVVGETWGFRGGDWSADAAEEALADAFSAAVARNPRLMERLQSSGKPVDWKTVARRILATIRTYGDRIAAEIRLLVHRQVLPPQVARTLEDTAEELAVYLDTVRKPPEGGQHGLFRDYKGGGWDEAYSVGRPKDLLEEAEKLGRVRAGDGREVDGGPAQGFSKQIDPEHKRLEKTMAEAHEIVHDAGKWGDLMDRMQSAKTVDDMRPNDAEMVAVATAVQQNAEALDRSPDGRLAENARDLFRLASIYDRMGTAAARALAVRNLSLQTQAGRKVYLHNIVSTPGKQWRERIAAETTPEGKERVYQEWADARNRTINAVAEQYGINLRSDDLGRGMGVDDAYAVARLIEDESVAQGLNKRSNWAWRLFPSYITGNLLSPASFTANISGAGFGTIENSAHAAARRYAYALAGDERAQSVWAGESAAMSVTGMVASGALRKMAAGWKGGKWQSEDISKNLSIGETADKGIDLRDPMYAAGEWAGSKVGKASLGRKLGIAARVATGPVREAVIVLDEFLWQNQFHREAIKAAQHAGITDPRTASEWIMSPQGARARDAAAAAADRFTLRGEPETWLGKQALKMLDTATFAGAVTNPDASPWAKAAHNVAATILPFKRALVNLSERAVRMGIGPADLGVILTVATHGKMGMAAKIRRLREQGIDDPEKLIEAAQLADQLARRVTYAILGTGVWTAAAAGVAPLALTWGEANDPTERSKARILETARGTKELAGGVAVTRMEPFAPAALTARAAMTMAKEIGAGRISTGIAAFISRGANINAGRSVLSGPIGLTKTEHDRDTGEAKPWTRTMAENMLDVAAPGRPWIGAARVATESKPTTSSGTGTDDLLGMPIVSEQVYGDRKPVRDFFGQEAEFRHKNMVSRLFLGGQKREDPEAVRWAKRLDDANQALEARRRSGEKTGEEPWYPLGVYRSVKVGKETHTLDPEEFEAYKSDVGKRVQANLARAPWQDSWSDEQKLRVIKRAFSAARAAAKPAARAAARDPD